MLTRTLFRIPMLLVVAVTGLVLTSCSQKDVVATIDTIASLLKENQQLIESYAADIKKSYTPGDPQYVEAQRQYTVARAAQDRMLNHIRAAVLLGTAVDTAPDVDTVVRSAQVEFMTSSTRSLAPSVQTSRIPFQRVTVPAIQVPANLPKADQARLLKKLDGVRWREWSDISK